MTHHVKAIPKGQLGEETKILEEMEEFKDALQQGSTILALTELSDLLGAIEHYLKRYNMTLADLYKLNEITQRAFERKKDDAAGNRRK